MGIFGRIFDKSKRAREATNTIAPAWKAISEKQPDMKGIDIARAIVTMRPAEYHYSYNMILDTFEKLSPEKSYLPKMLIDTLITNEILLKFNIEIDDTTRTLWDDAITEELEKFGFPPDQINQVSEQIPVLYKFIVVHILPRDKDDPLIRPFLDYIESRGRNESTHISNPKYEELIQYFEERLDFSKGIFDQDFPDEPKVADILKDFIREERT